MLKLILSQMNPRMVVTLLRFHLYPKSWGWINWFSQLRQDPGKFSDEIYSPLKSAHETALQALFFLQSKTEVGTTRLDLSHNSPYGILPYKAVHGRSEPRREHFCTVVAGVSGQSTLMLASSRERLSNVPLVLYPEHWMMAERLPDHTSLQSWNTPLLCSLLAWKTTTVNIDFKCTTNQIQWKCRSLLMLRSSLL